MDRFITSSGVSVGTLFTADGRSLYFWVTLSVAVTVPAVVAGWFCLRQWTEHYVPHEYQYRPGTISRWLARQLSLRAKRRRGTKPVRVYMDGCFDMMHYGHANAIRQAKALGDQLVVGIIPDEEVRKTKGCAPVLSESERLALLDGIKWVDEVLTGVPYELTPDFTDELFSKHRIDYIIHGDDPCLLPDGTDAYAYAKKLDRFKMIKRTEGVSTTDIVGRMLTCTRVNPFVLSEEQRRQLSREFSDGGESDGNNSEQRTVVSRFMPTSRRIVQFSNDPEERSTATNIVYIDGAFDVFHVGHVAILKEAKALGDFLLVGLHTDEDVMKRRGPHLPIMNLHERSLSVLACKYVDEVIIGITPHISEDLIRAFNISTVVRGSASEFTDDVDDQRYAVPRRKGIFKVVESPSSMTTLTLIKRIVDNHAAFLQRHREKSARETAFYAGKREYIEEL